MTTYTTTVHEHPHMGHVKLHIFNRISSYPIVTDLWERARSYYNAVKSYTPLTHKSFQVAEYTVANVVTQILPFWRQVEQHPLALRADEVGCRQLDRIEYGAGTTKNFVEKWVISPLAGILTTSENFIEKWIPREDEDVALELNSTAAIPLRIFKDISLVSSRLRRRANRKLLELKNEANPGQNSEQPSQLEHIDVMQAARKTDVNRVIKSLASRLFTDPQPKVETTEQVGEKQD